jgi:hypothetical protein
VAKQKKRAAKRLRAVNAEHRKHAAVTDPRDKDSVLMGANGRVALDPMKRILDSIAMEPELVADRNKARYLIQVNQLALEDWRARLPTRHGLVTELKGHTSLTEVVEVLLRHRGELHQFFRHLLYPELAVKTLPAKLLQQWGGALEAYDVRITTMRAVVRTGATRTDATEMCRAWLAACTCCSGDIPDRTVAGEGHRWAKLTKLCPEVIGGARPGYMPQEHWNGLHLLPYVTWMGPATPWECMPSSHLSHHYFEQPMVQRLCGQVEERAAW